MWKYREFPYALYLASSIINILHWNSTCVTIDESILIHLYSSKSILRLNFLVFASGLFPVPGFYSRFRVRFSPPVSLVSSGLWQSLRLCWFLLTLAIGGVPIRYLINWDLSDDFLVIRQGLRVLGRKTTEVKCHLHYISAQLLIEALHFPPSVGYGLKIYKPLLAKVVLQGICHFHKLPDPLLGLKLESYFTSFVYES